MDITRILGQLNRPIAKVKSSAGGSSVYDVANRFFPIKNTQTQSIPMQNIQMQNTFIPDNKQIGSPLQQSMQDETSIISALAGNNQQISEIINSGLAKKPALVKAIKFIDENNLYEILNPTDQLAVRLALKYGEKFFITQEQIDDQFLEHGIIGAGAGTPTIIETDADKAEKAKESALNAMVREQIKDTPYGDRIMQNEAYKILADKGFLPDMEGRNIWGMASQHMKFPLQKILSGLGAFSRGIVGQKLKEQEHKEYISIDEYEQLPLEEQLKLLANPANSHLAVFGTGKIEVPSQVTGEQLKEEFKAFGRGFANIKGSPEEGISGKTFMEQVYPDSTEKAEWAKDTDDWVKGFNWIQKILSAFVGSPADIGGLIIDIGSNPLTYMSSGTAQSSIRVGRATKDVVDKAGNVIIPKGGEIYTSNIGTQLIKDATSAGLRDRVVQQYANVISNMNAETATSFVDRVVAESVLRASAARGIGNPGIFDLGGFKALGETIIPGHMFAGLGSQAGAATSATTALATAGQAGQALAQIGSQAGVQTATASSMLQKIFSTVKDVFKKPTDVINKAFNYYAGVPSEFRPSYAFSEEQTRHITEGYIGDFADILKPLSVEERETLNQMGAITRDLAKKIKHLDQSLQIYDDVKELADREPMLFGEPQDLKRLRAGINREEKTLRLLEDHLRKLNITPKVQTAYDTLQTLFRGMRQDAISYLGEEAVPKDISYYPTRWETADKTLRSSSILGPDEATFQKQKVLDYLKAIESDRELKPIESSLAQVSHEYGTAIGRKIITDEIKQFGQMIKDKTEVPAGYVQLTDVKGEIIPELKDFYFPKEYSEVFRNVKALFLSDEGAKGIVKAYDRFLTMFKRWALMTPRYHLRNIMSDTSMGIVKWGVDFLNPVHPVDYIKLLLGGSLKTTNIAGREVTYTLKDLFRSGIMEGQYREEGLGRLAGEQFLKKVSKLGNNVDNIIDSAKKFLSPAEFSMMIGQFRENFGRAIGGIVSLKQGKSLADAAWDVKNAFFDYKAITPFESNLAKRVIPFYTWTKKNVSRQIEILSKEPGKYAALGSILSYLSRVSDETEEEKEFKPDYFDEQAMIKTQMKDEFGHPLYIHPDLPYEIFNELSPSELLSQSSPLLKWPLEMIVNKDFFTGYEIVKEGRKRKQPQWLSFLSKVLPDKVIETIGGERDAEGNLFLSDRWSHTLKQVPFLENLSKLLPPEETAKTKYDMLSILGGIRLVPLNVDREKEKRYREYTDEINTEISTYNIMHPDDQIESATKLKSSINDYYDFILRQIHNVDEIEEAKSFVESAPIEGKTKLKQHLNKLLEPYKEELKEFKQLSLHEAIVFLEDLEIAPVKDDILDILLNKKESELVHYE